jgi:thiopurine S-methyltransferase
MDPQFWLQRWANNQIGFHRPDVHPYLQTHWPRLELDSAARVFVPLCGKSLDLIWLRDIGHEVFGVEISPVAVEAFFSENGMPVRRKKMEHFQSFAYGRIQILCGDLFDLEPAQLTGVAACYDRASLVAFASEHRPRYAEHLQRLLPRTTRMLVVTLEYPQKEMHGPPFSVPEAELRRLFEGRYNIDLLESIDLLKTEPRWRQAGLSRMREKVFMLCPTGF